MQWNGFRVHIVIISVILGLLVFAGGHWLYEKYNYDEPLDKILSSNKAVESYKLSDKDQPVTVRIKLKNVDNLGKTYHELDNSLKEVLGEKEYKIELLDNRDKQLEDIFYHSQFAVYEAMARGNYREMEQYVSRQAAASGAQASVFMDREAVYLQIKHGDYYLYEIIPVNSPENQYPGLPERG
ncbi:hypothetical protein DCCM_0887 [Desulfocucumis palustris]|uniref:Uncharacterized protein n=1 Tax=Desulfocucumis palustris TaxID=1898651 RepID=A0A2L2XFQ2_9FIRM|nr:hypothetical protein [Desulfocucumis palustris]GBF32691.1 hypothetical protein DCCM_0887 [Desulfocucumis palustris]